ncbi:MAG: 50S ribosomal protein L18 [bacterium]|nr:50S ribosomal protein L18 [bacterium]
MIEKFKDHKKVARERRKRHIRARILGTQERPRLVVYRSLKQTYCQLVDDIAQRTITGLSTAHKEIVEQSLSGKVAKSKALGILVAKKAKELGIEKVVFDRNGYPYHGRIAAVAEGAREGGLLL